MSGQIVHELRGRKFMTQRDLAARVGCGVPHISKIEAGKERPSVEMCHALALALDVSGEHLAARFGYLPDWADELLRSHPMLTLLALGQTANSVAQGGCCCGASPCRHQGIPVPEEGATDE